MNVEAFKPVTRKCVGFLFSEFEVNEEEEEEEVHMEQLESNGKWN